METEKKLLPWDKDSALDFAGIMREKYVNAIDGSVESYVYYLAIQAAANIAEHFITNEPSLLVTDTEYWNDLYSAWLLDNKPKANFRLPYIVESSIDYAEIERDYIKKYYPEYDDPSYVDCIYYGILDYTPAERLIEEIY